MSKIKNGGLDQYDAEPFEQQQFGTAGIEGVNVQCLSHVSVQKTSDIQQFSLLKNNLANKLHNITDINRFKRCLKSSLSSCAFK